MHLICKLRDDADLRYLHKGTTTGKRGRPKKYDGKVDNLNIDMDNFSLVSKDDHAAAITAIVYSKSLKRNVRVVHVFYSTGKHKLYFSTDTEMEASEILKFFQSRFQIEFLYRDGKQHTGLNDCQARSENKLDFHFNAALTAINLAKAAHWLNIPKEFRKSFSMTDIKTINHNTLQLNLFFDKIGINQESSSRLCLGV